MGEPDQAGGTDPVEAALVLGDLLGDDVDLPGQLDLRDPELLAASAQDEPQLAVQVDRVAAPAIGSEIDDQGVLPGVIICRQGYLSQVDECQWALAGNQAYRPCGKRP